jgi:hypothetical protein
MRFQVSGRGFEGNAEEIALRPIASWIETRHRFDAGAQRRRLCADDVDLGREAEEFRHRLGRHLDRVVGASGAHSPMAMRAAGQRIAMPKGSAQVWQGGRQAQGCATRGHSEVPVTAGRGAGSLVAGVPLLTSASHSDPGSCMKTVGPGLGSAPQLTFAMTQVLSMTRPGAPTVHGDAACAQERTRTSMPRGARP